VPSIAGFKKQGNVSSTEQEWKDCHDRYKGTVLGSFLDLKLT
jgi:hypothetical protein